MAQTKSERQLAWEGLDRLLVDRVDPEAPMNEIFHWGIFKKKRNPENDRPVALVAAAVLEQGLEHALLVMFTKRNKSVVREELFQARGAILREFSAKVSMAYVLGVIGTKTRSDLSAIRRIRNVFAHSRLKIDFETPEIQRACAQIALPHRTLLVDEKAKTDMREAYIQTCFELSTWLFTYETYAFEKRKADRWPLDLLTS